MEPDGDKELSRNRLRGLLCGKFSRWRLMRSLLFIYLAIGGYAYFFSDRQIFQPQPSSYRSRAARQTDDQTIPFWHRRALFDRANQPKIFLEVSGADHNDVEQIAGERYNQTLRTFLQTLKQPQKS